MKRYLSALFFVIIISGLVWIFWSVKESKDGQKLDESRFVELNGQREWIYMRADHADNPVILYLHGGPGMIESFFAQPLFQGPLEEEFVVVHWDQRGSGMSYDPGMDQSLLNPGQLVDDTIALAEWLKARFRQQKIVLVGHSWGSFIGFKAAQKRPDLFYGYVGIGQIADTPNGEQISYDFVLEKARETSNQDALKELMAIGKPPYAEPIAHTLIQRKWLGIFGGAVQDGAVARHLAEGLVSFPLYPKGFAGSYQEALIKNFQNMGSDFLNANLLNGDKTVSVPVWLISGAYDFNTPVVLSQKLLDQLMAPEKRFIRFEKSAHYPNFEEPKHFAEVMKAFKAAYIR